MNSKKKSGRKPNELRQRAEEIDRERVSQTPDIMEALTPEAAWQLIHQLRVDRIELELLVDIRTIYHPSDLVSGDSYFMGWRKKGKLL